MSKRTVLAIAFLAFLAGMLVRPLIGQGKQFSERYDFKGKRIQATYTVSGGDPQVLKFVRESIHGHLMQMEGSLALPAPMDVMTLKMINDSMLDVTRKIVEALSGKQKMSKPREQNWVSPQIPVS